MRLSDLLKFDDIAVQCHDNPDADSVASGFGIYRYLCAHGKSPLLFYSGGSRISKSNMLIMTERLDIPVQYLHELDHEPELLITADCTYGEGNVTRFEARNIAVIDHHKSTTSLPALSEVRSTYGSCSTLVFKMLSAEGTDINSDKQLATALYYGLYMDTNGMAEIGHPADKDLRDYADYDRPLMMLLKNSNLSSWEMLIAGDALKTCRYIPEYNMAVAYAEPCDPNILGFINDLILQVDTVQSCVVFCEYAAGYKISVRSCTDDTDAAEFARFITRDVGSGGGHARKAGGYINGTMHDGIDIRKFIYDKMIAYRQSIVILHAGKEHIDLTGMRKYEKLGIVIGYVPSTDIAPVGSELLIRMLEGDSVVHAGEDIYIMVGISGEVYPIKRDVFGNRYTFCDALPEMDYEYTPTVRIGEEHVSRPLTQYIKGCRAKGGSAVMARQLTGYAKVYSEWKDNDYLYGEPGDYLAARIDDDTDFYIIKQKVFDRSYRLMQ